MKRTGPRAKPVAPAVKRERVFLIARTMVTGEWGDGADCTKRLAAEWKVSLATVQYYAAEASRLLDFHANDREQLIKLGQIRLRQIGEEDGPDRVPAWRTLFENLGELRKRVEMSGVVGGPPIGIAASVTVKQEPLDHLRSLLRDPPPELEAILLEEWGPRTVSE